MKIDSESSEDSDSQHSEHNNDFEGFLDRYLKYLKVPGHCNGKNDECNGPNSDESTDLTPIFEFIKFVTECNLMKESCNERNETENGLTWNVTKNDNVITIEYKDSHGNEIQSQKWTKTGRIHVLIRNHKGEFIKMAGKYVEDGPSHGSFFRLFCADSGGNHIKCFENDKKRRVKFLASDGHEDSYTIKDLKISKNKGNHWRKFKGRHDRHSKNSFTFEDDSSSSFSGGEIGGIEILGFGPGGFGFGSPPPMFDCGGFGGGFGKEHHWYHHFGSYPFGSFMGFGGKACPICGEKE
ncbi:hypothetical protein DdX_03754 [Ditylenchus destructor]|uniref:Uncharacterized protein n=1 Tax=Ditylenchus destructor TaxID=166010 RepID=A0AAD4NCC9_9BILA|nr:hypothetical protein DdX_03754 [Ditylenchus destructor]